MLAVHSVPVRVSALQPPAPIIQDVAVDIDVEKSRWHIALAISSDVQNQQPSRPRHFQSGRERKHPDDKPLVHHEQSSYDLRAALLSKVRRTVRWQRQTTPPFQLLQAPIQCNAGICLYVLLACGCTMYVTTFDSAPHHADRVSRNGMQAWRSCNGERRDEMRWRVGKDGKVNARNHTCMSRVQPPTQMVYITSSRNYIFTTSKAGMHGHLKSALSSHLMALVVARNSMNNL